MKKFTAMILVLLFVLSFAGSALADTKYNSYKHSLWGYTLEYPASYQFAGEGTGLSDAVSFIAADGDNFNVAGMYIGERYSAEELLEQLMPSLLQEYKSVMPGIKFLVEGDIYEAGGKKYAMVAYSWNSDGTDVIGVQFCNCDNGALFYITYTSCEAANTAQFVKDFGEFAHVLKTFVY